MKLAGGVEQLSRQIDHDRAGRSTTSLPREGAGGATNLPSYLERRAAPLVADAWEDIRVVAVFGARQAGKSTIVRVVSRDIPTFESVASTVPPNSRWRQPTRLPLLTTMACSWWTKSSALLSCCPSRPGSMRTSAPASTSSPARHGCWGCATSRMRWLDVLKRLNSGRSRSVRGFPGGGSSAGYAA